MIISDLISMLGLVTSLVITLTKQIRKVYVTIQHTKKKKSHKNPAIIKTVIVMRNIFYKEKQF